MPENGTRAVEQRSHNARCYNVLRNQQRVLLGCNTFAEGKIVASVLQVLVSSLQRVPHVRLLPATVSNPNN